MPRPLKPTITAPTEGAGFGLEASETLMQVPVVAEFIDSSNAYQEQIVTAPGGRGVLPSDPSAVGVSVPTARQPLFVNAARDGLTAVRPTRTDTETFLRTQMVGGGGARDARLTDYGTVDDYTGVFQITTFPSKLLPTSRGSNAIRGQERGFRFLEMGTPFEISRTVPGGAFPQITSDGRKLRTERHRGLGYGPYNQALPMVFHAIIELPDVSNYTTLPSGTPANSPVVFTLDVNSGRTLSFHAEADRWRASCTAFGSASRNIELQRTFRGGVLCIRLMTTDVTMTESMFSISIGEIPSLALINSSNYNTLEASHPNHLANTAHFSADAMPAPDGADSYIYMDNTIAEEINSAGTGRQTNSGVGIKARLFDLQLQSGGALAMLDGLR